VRYCVGIDLGSTTTKAVVVDEEGRILGRGITNSRSNYEVARDVALAEALTDARFGLLARGLECGGLAVAERKRLVSDLERGYREQQYRGQLDVLERALQQALGNTSARRDLAQAVGCIVQRMRAEVAELYSEGSRRKSDFFRDLAGSRYLALAEGEARSSALSFDELAGVFDKAILAVETQPQAEGFGSLARAAARGLEGGARLLGAIERATETPLEELWSVGTGYGRATLPFPKERIRSEILCHGLGAHALFPRTRTVLDIGGQDTKAIQIDQSGIVTSFQMNDRCAAGCGRYLGYIADEMSLGLHQLGPLACAAKRTVRINSTCTVFAGAELRERLSLGERREDILAGLHRAIVLRAMSLLARSGGVHSEFTFTGGVANNSAAVAALRDLVRENYGEIQLNISPDSIYTGALGAALFAQREWRQGQVPSALQEQGA
jgi:benzoyl-CoA reductase subunit A